jgi:hypothetical protein
VAFGLSTKKDINNVKFAAQDWINGGKAITDQSLLDLRNLSGGYQDLINRGGLTPALNREYDVQGGRISDDATRAARSFRSSLSSQAAAGGGFLSPAAQAELSARNESNINEGTFNARNSLAFDKARVSQQATSELQDRILKVADMTRTTGLTREQMGQAALIQAAVLKLQQKGQTLGALTSILHAGVGGGGG